MRPPAETEGGPAARSVAAAAKLGAQTPLIEVSPVSELMRDLENAALAELDALAARRLVDTDRRFARATSKLDTELARRQDAESQDLRRRHPVTMDASGFVVAAISVGVLLAGRRAGTSIPTDGALVAAALLGVGATVLHVASSLRSARSGAIATQGWYLVLFSTVLLFASAAIGYWRYSTDPDAGFLTAAVTIGVLIAAGVFTAVLVAKGAGARAEEARRTAAAAAREEALRTDLRTQLTELTTLCRTEAERVFDSLDPQARASLDTAVEAGISAVEKRGVLETDALRDMRTSRRGQLRYDVSL